MKKSEVVKEKKKESASKPKNLKLGSKKSKEIKVVEKESELEDILDEDELEEIAEDLEEESFEAELDDTQLERFITAPASPVLERIAGEQRVVFVGGGREGDEGEEKNQTSYSTREYQSDTIKYDKPAESFSQGTSTESINVGLAGRDTNSMSQDFVFGTPESRERQNSERDYFQPKTFEQRNEGMPIEQKQEKKYQEFKP